MGNKELGKIFNGSQDAINEMKRVFKEHENIETVIISPESWVGKELLIQTRRLIELERNVCNLVASINRLKNVINKLANNFNAEQ